MTTSAVNASSAVFQLLQSQSTQSTQGAEKPPEGPPPGPPPEMKESMLSSLTDLLSQLGVDLEQAEDGSATLTEEQSAALTEFMDSLMESLHAQHGDMQPPAEGSEGTPPPPPPDMAADIDSLMSALASGDAETSELSSSFDSLLSALGVEDGSITLDSFLNAFSANLPDEPKGGFIDTSA